MAVFCCDSAFCRTAAEPECRAGRYAGMQNDPRNPERVVDSEIEPITFVLFVLIIFLIVPFTMLSPFRYPQPSALDALLSVNGGPAIQVRQVDARRFTGRTREIDLALSSTDTATASR
jgi:hypothetical protein